MECVASSLPQLALIFAQKVLNIESNITEHDSVQQAAFAFANEMEKMDLKHGIDVC